MKSITSILIILIVFISCSKEEMKPPPDKEYFVVSIAPSLNGQPFFFEQDYLINSKKVRISSLSFPLKYTTNETVFLNEFTAESEYAVNFQIWQDTFNQVALRFYHQTTESRYNCWYVGQDEECETDTYTVTSGGFGIEGRVDLDNDGILEERFGFNVPLEDLKLQKGFDFVDPILGLPLTFDIQDLFFEIDAGGLDRISTQFRMAENLPAALKVN